jgi:asparagine synthase (glutamine-hydrolysing)
MLKAFDEKPIVDSEAVYEYLFFQYIPTPRTIFTGIRKLAPGHTLEFDGGIVSIREYWDVKYSQKKDSDERIHSKKILEILDDSVQTRLMSDVPLGAFLSGGLDSSGIVSLMSRRVEAPIDTFSVGFEDVPDAYNELSHARKVSEIFGTTHHEVLMNPSGAVKILPQVISRLDEPLGDYAVLPTFAVSELARRRVKVVLTGEGADELFGGYYHYLRELEKHRMLYAGRKKSFLKAKIKSPLGQEGSVWQDSLDPWYAGSTNIFTPHQKKELLEENPDEALNAPSAYKKAYRETTASHILDKMLYADFKIWLPDDLLMKVDWMSMAHSLEARVPYLDHRLVEYAAGIPWNLKIRGGTLKYILKKSLSGVLPRQIVRRRKHGFTVPLKEWFNGELGDFAFQVLDKSSIFNRDYVKKISWKNSRVACSQLWRLFVLESWVKTHVYGEKLC